jgi:beta-galactosidase
MNKKQFTVICMAIVLMFLSECDEPLNRVGLSAKALNNAREVKSLDGTWEIIFDHENAGREAEWHLDKVFSAQSTKRNITVPSAWELIEKDYEGVAFYRRAFKVPANWEGKIIRLQFDAVNYLSEVWLNDEVVGFHEGGFTPFEFRVDEMIKPGQTNVLTVRVVGPIIMSDKQVDGVGKMETPQWRGGITGGIWQSVRLVATGDIYVDDVFIEPKISDNTATFHVQLDHTAIKGTSASIEIDILEASGPSKSVAKVYQIRQLHPGKNNNSWTLNIPDAKYWSPDDPHLYRADLSVVSNGVISDRWSRRFGMREMTIKNKDFYLNGKPIYIKACFFEGLYPNGIAFPDSEDMALKEIRLAKEAGFNMIRPWRRPAAPMWLDLADEIGVLVVGSPALECMRLPLSTSYLPSRVENEVRGAILRDRNRACVVQWELFNELHRPVLKQLMRPMAMIARKLDPTRLILDESGGWAFGANMYLPYEYEPTKFNDIHNYPGPFIHRNQYDGYLAIGLTEDERKDRGLRWKSPGRNVVPGLMSFVSELGYGSLPDLADNNDRFEKRGNPLTPAYRYHKRLAEGQKQVLQESGFNYLYPDLKQFYLDQQRIHGTANKRMIEAVRSNPEVDGYCIHALVAGDWIIGAGLLDLWRNPKSYAYEGTKAANQPRILSIRTKPRNVYAEQGTKIEINGVNDLSDIKGTLKLELVSDSGRTVFTKEVNVNMISGVTQLFSERLNTKALKGTYTLKAQIIADDSRQITENEYNFDVFTPEQLTVPKKRIAILDTDNSLKTFLKNSNVTFEEFSATTDHSLAVFVTGDKAKNNKRFKKLFAFVKSGGTAVYIDPVKETITGKSSMYPFTAKVHPARGLWTCIPHLVSDHPVFAGLPVNCMMRNVYENIWPMDTLRELTGAGDMKLKTLVASIGFDWFSEDHKMQYSGPGEAWWGSDVAVIPYGKGRCIVSQLRLTNNLGKDPVADKILFNLIEWTD